MCTQWESVYFMYRLSHYSEFSKALVLTMLPSLSQSKKRATELKAEIHSSYISFSSLNKHVRLWVRI